MQKIVEAIHLIRPNAEFVIYGKGLDNIKWHVLEGQIPTKKEIEQAVKDLAAADLAKEQQKIATKNAILERLGLTADEAALLFS